MAQHRRLIPKLTQKHHTYYRDTQVDLSVEKKLVGLSLPIMPVGCSFITHALYQV